MSTQDKIGIALAVMVIAMVLGLWELSNARGLRVRGRTRGRDGDAKAAQRKSDTRHLKGPERRLYNESQKLLKQGKIAAAARILEQLNMPREAIQALEDNGLIHDAAKILMRMQRHNRAGVVYARHGMWDNACQCFKLANMPLEVAKCAREAGDLTTAAEYFEKVGRYEDTGECYEALGEHLKAARLFATAGQRQRAMSLYNRVATEATNVGALELDDNEMQQIVDYLAEGNTDRGLAGLVANRNRLSEVVNQLASKALVKQASELIVLSTSDIGPMLMADVSYQTRAAGCLAEVFAAVGQFYYAGMVYERMNSFELAAGMFERAEDYERAAYCYERAGVDFKVKALKEKARLSQKAPSRGDARSGFALSAVATKADAPAFSDTNDEKTSILERGDKPEAPEIPPVPARAERPQKPPPPPARHEATSPTPPAPAFSLQAIDEEATDEVVTPAPRPVNGEDDQAAFHKASFFGDLDLDQKNKLWSIGSTLSFGPEETVLTYNDEPRGVYVIVKGSIGCYRLVNGKESYVDQMGESESFGELWLLADQPTAVRFVASQSSRVRVIGRDAFNDLLDRDGLLARKLYKRFTMRLLKRLLKPQVDPQQAKTQQAS